MNKNRLYRFAALPLSVYLLLGTVSPSMAFTLPQAPEGYSWQQIKDLKAAVLRPDGWLFESNDSGGRYQYMLTKNKGHSLNDASDGTSLTIVVRRQPVGEGDARLAPSRLSAALFAEISNNRVLERTQSAVQGPFETIRYQYVDDSGPVREYSLLVANDATGTLYIFTFLAPVAEWEEDWQTISLVLDRIFLDDEI